MDLSKFPIRMKVWSPDGGTIEIDGHMADPDVRRVIERLLEESRPQASAETIALAHSLGFSGARP